MDKIETILTNCIKEIKSGKATLAECLNRYPTIRQELESLLKVALNIQKPQILKLDSNYKQVAKAQLLQQIKTSRQNKYGSFTDIFSFKIPPQYTWARVVTLALVVVILLSSLAGGTAYAAQGSIPGDFLYPVKITTEDARLLITRDDSAKVKLNLQFAQTRLEEMSKLANADEGKTERAVNGYHSNLGAALQQIRGISDTSTLSSLLNQALDDVQSQIIFCDGLIDEKPKYIEPVREASTFSISEQLELLQMLALQNNISAAQVNLNLMQNRLRRAQEKVNGDQFQLMQEVLLQYQQFNQLGERILQNAQSTNQNNTEIEAITLKALAGYLNTLDSISQHVPQEYRSSIETCRQLTIELQNQARYRYQQQGNSGRGHQSQTTENGSGSTTGQNNQSTTQYQGETNNPDNGTPNTVTPSQGAGGGSGSGSSTGPSGDMGASGGTGSSGGTDSGGGNGGG